MTKQQVKKSNLGKKRTKKDVTAAKVPAHSTTSEKKRKKEKIGDEPGYASEDDVLKDSTIETIDDPLFNKLTEE